MHILASAMNGTTAAAPNGRSADLAATQLSKKKIESIDRRVEHAALFAVRRPRPLPLAD
jgi:hypothetical protein